MVLHHKILTRKVIFEFEKDSLANGLFDISDEKSIGDKPYLCFGELADSEKLVIWAYTNKSIEAGTEVCYADYSRTKLFFSS